ncbi:hypothetical protein [Microbacterium sp.]|uniref:hypothetical protein n=1 Tax=Microbacterium sp. TaxID=51671 RepID=UPI003C73CFD2
MRTTMIINDELYRQVKERARAEERTVTSFVEDALRRELQHAEEPRTPFVVKPFSPPPGKGGTWPGVDLMDKDQIQDLLDEDDFTVQQIRRSRRS